MPIREGFGVRIERLRQQAGLDSRHLDRLAGLGEGHSRQLEIGLRPNVSAATIARIADVFGVTSDWLFRGIGSAPKPADVRRAAAQAAARGPLARAGRPQAAAE